jgi:hypothetical protein
MCSYHRLTGAPLIQSRALALSACTQRAALLAVPGSRPALARLVFSWNACPMPHQTCGAQAVASRAAAPRPPMSPDNHEDKRNAARAAELSEHFSEVLHGKPSAAESGPAAAEEEDRYSADIESPRGAQLVSVRATHTLASCCSARCTGVSLLRALGVPAGSEAASSRAWGVSSSWCLVAGTP